MRADTPQDFYETYVGLRPISNAHPPSLRKPIPVPIPMAQDGWHRGDSKKAREEAIERLMTILRRSVRQIGKPTPAATAKYPAHPSIMDWL
jgi:hypothetical protein